MAVVNVSLDTNTRQLALTINGVLVPASECFVEKYVYDGDEVIRLSYTVASVNADGLKEVRQFHLPSAEELMSLSSASLDESGFASKIVGDKEQAMADTVNFLKASRNREQ